MLEKQANEKDIAPLIEEALEAENRGNLELAEQLWTRVLAVSPANEKALKALKRIWQKQKNVNLGKTIQNNSENDRIELIDDENEDVLSKVIETSHQNDEIELLSEKNVDYTKLQEFLANGEWKKADEETVIAMAKCARQQQQNLFGLNNTDLDDRVLPELLITTYLIPESIKNFPSTDLQTIDKLWVKYSNGRFGFSVQKRIYQMLRGAKSYDEKIWKAFGQEVGWYREGKWSYYSDLTFNLNEARAGHLPGYLVFKKGVEDKDGWEIISILSHRKL